MVTIDIKMKRLFLGREHGSQLTCTCDARFCAEPFGPRRYPEEASVFVGEDLGRMVWRRDLWDYGDVALELDLTSVSSAHGDSLVI
jgi:hypothetical protein